MVKPVRESVLPWLDAVGAQEVVLVLGGLRLVINTRTPGVMALPILLSLISKWYAHFIPKSKQHFVKKRL